MAYQAEYLKPMRSADPCQKNLDIFFGKVKYFPNGELLGVI